MITEDFVSFETAKLLKEKGFDEKTGSYYQINSFGEPVVLHDTKHHYNRSANKYCRCTQSVAMKWLREEKGLFIQICCDDLDYYWQVLDVLNRDDDGDPILKSESFGGYNVYEEAVEAALKYCLENLI